MLWAEWRFKFAAWLASVDPAAATALKEAAASERHILAVNIPEHFRRLSGFLYAALVNYTGDGPLQVVRGIEDFNGWEAWRMVVYESSGT